MQCLHLLRRYFVPLPWRFLAQPELQQGSDRLNCKQKHFLVLHAIKLIVYTSMNKLRAWLRFGAGATFRPSIFRHSHQANSVFGDPKFRAGGPKFCTSSLIGLWQTLDITMVGVYHVQMWKWIIIIFLCDIFSGARGMLKSLCNHRQSQRPGATGRNGGLFGADAEKNSLSWPLNRLQWSLYQQAGGTRSKYNYWRRKGLTEQ